MKRSVFVPLPSKQAEHLVGRLWMRTVHSADGTKIAFDQTGQGPPVILIVGAFNDRSTGAPLAEALESQLTVLNYDRRGPGARGGTQPYAGDGRGGGCAAPIPQTGGGGG